MSVDPASCLMLSAILFTVGAFGVVARRDPAIALMSIQLMLAAGALALVALSRLHGRLDGQALALLLLGVSGAQAAVGLGIVVALARREGR